MSDPYRHANPTHAPAEPRMLTQAEKARILEFQEMIHYSTRYSDDNFEYRHVILPKAMLKAIPRDYFNHETGTLRILHDSEWRGLGITQSLGWEHYENHAPEPHILLFKYVVFSWLFLFYSNHTNLCLLSPVSSPFFC